MSIEKIESSLGDRDPKSRILIEGMTEEETEHTLEKKCVTRPFLIECADMDEVKKWNMESIKEIASKAVNEGHLREVLYSIPGSVMSEELFLSVVEREPWALVVFIRNNPDVVTERMVRSALEKDGMILEILPDNFHTRELEEAALNQNLSAYEFVSNDFPEKHEKIIRHDPYLINKIESPAEKLVELAITINPYVLGELRIDLRSKNLLNFFEIKYMGGEIPDGSTEQKIRLDKKISKAHHNIEAECIKNPYLLPLTNAYTNKIKDFDISSFRDIAKKAAEDKHLNETLRHFPKWAFCEEVFMPLVEIDPWALQIFIRRNEQEVTEKMKRAALEKDGMILEVITDRRREMTNCGEDLMALAIKQNPSAYKFVKSYDFPESYEQIIQHDPYLITKLVYPTPELIELAITLDPYIFRELKGALRDKAVEVFEQKYGINFDK